MEYKIEVHQDDIEIFWINGEKFLHVKRTHSWTGKAVVRVYKDDKLIFESRSSSFLFNKKVIVKCQDLKDPVRIETSGRKMLLLYNANILEVRLRILSNPVAVFYNKGKTIGEVHSEKMGISFPPGQYKAIFDNDNDEHDNLYSLILLSVRMPTLY